MRRRWQTIVGGAAALTVAAAAIAAIPVAADTPTTTTAVPVPKPMVGSAVISNQMDNHGAVRSTAVTPSGTVWAVQTNGYTGTASTSRLIRLPNDSLSPQIVDPALDSYAPGDGAVVTAAGESVYVAKSVDPGVVHLRRYTPDGRWDRTYGALGTANLTASFGEACAVQLVPSPIEGWPEPEPNPPCVYSARSVAVDSTGAVTVLITARSPEGQYVAQNFLVRAASTGGIDPTFGVGGVAAIGAAPESYAGSSKHTVDAQSRPIVSHYGVYSAASIAFDRFTPAGAPDVGFGQAGRATVAVPGARLTCAMAVSVPDCQPALHPDGSFAFATTAVAENPADPMKPYASYIGVVDADGDVQLREYCGPTGYFPTGGCSLFFSPVFSTINGQLHLVGNDGSASLSAIPFPFPASGPLKPSELTYFQGVDGRPSSTYSLATGDAGGPIVARVGRYSVSTPESYATYDVLGRVDLDDIPEGATGWVSPQSGAYDVGSAVTVTYACEDAPLCFASLVDGEIPDPLPAGWTPSGSSQSIASGHELDTSQPGVRTVIIVTLGPGNQPLELARARYDIGGAPQLPGEHGTTEDAGTFSTGGLPSSEDWLNTDVTTPVGGAVRVHETSQPGAALSGYQWFPVAAEVDSPVQSVEQPLVTRFRIDRGALDSLSASSLVVAHDETIVPNCTGQTTATAALPNPCVKSRRNLSASTAEVTVFSTGGDLGNWGFGRVTATLPSKVTGIWAAPTARSIDVWWGALHLEESGGAPVREYRIVATPVGVPDGVTAAVRNVTLAGEEVAPGRLFGKVTQVVPGVTYELTISARNTVLSGWGEASPAPEPVTVGSLPGIPSGVSAAAGVKSATVNWAEPVTDEPVVSYTVVGTATRFDGSIHRVSKKVTGDPVPTTAVLTGLSSGLEYSFTVAATSAVGAGSSSPPSSAVRTPEVPAAPELVHATPGVRSAAVSWSEPASDEPVTGYTVTAQATRPDGSVHRVSKALNGEPPARAHTFTGLVPGLSYSFSVSATSAVGRGPASPFGQPVQLSGLPAAPTGVQATEAGPRSVSLRWDAPGADEPVTRYDLSGVATRSDGTLHRVSASVTGEPAATGHVFSRLESGLSYSFSVVATTVVGKGAVSAPSAPVALPAVPSAPQSVSVTAGVRSAVVEWVPGESDLPVSKYTIIATAERGDATVHRVTKSVVGDPVPSAFTVTGLTPGLSYSFTVAATSAAGAGAPAAAEHSATPDFGVSISDRATTEGNKGYKNFAFTVTLTDVRSVPVEVELETQAVSAGSTDFEHLTTTVVFEPGQRSKSINVRVAGDTEVEEDEEFHLVIRSATSGTVTKATGIGTIRNDD